MGLDTTVELALANMDLNDPVLEPVRFDDLEGSTSIPTDVEATMDTGEEEDAEESSGDHDDGTMMLILTLIDALRLVYL